MEGQDLKTKGRRGGDQDPETREGTGRMTIGEITTGRIETVGGRTKQMEGGMEGIGGVLEEMTVVGGEEGIGEEEDQIGTEGTRTGQILIH